MNHDISVIVAVYNAERYLDECVNSIISQNYSYLEIILVDDGSTDHSLDVCMKLHKRDSRIKVFHKDNGGPLSARRLGVEHASADLIMFVDADDWIAPGMCQKLYAEMECTHVDVVVSGIIRYISDNCQKYDYNGISPGIYKGTEYKSKILPYMLCDGFFFKTGIDPSMSVKIFRKKLLYPWIVRADEEYGCHYGDDSSVVYPYLLAAESMVILDQCFYYHRQYENHMAIYTEDPEYEKKLIKLQLYLKDIFMEQQEKAVLMKQLDWFISYSLLNKYKNRAAKMVSEVPGLEQYLFPFHKVRKGSRLLLYGAGNVGKIFYRQLQQTGYCKEIIWQDKNYQSYCRQWPVQKPDVHVTMDICVIAVADRYLADRIREDLKSQGLIETKIIWEKPELCMW